MNNISNLPLIIAHRGAAAIAPENTLAAFKKAIEDEADGIEFDVRLSKDGEAVVFHDADLKRIAGRDEKIIDLSLEELRQIEIGSWFNRAFPKLADEKFSNETIPALKDVLNLLNDFRGLIYIELKCREREVEPLVRAVCREISASYLLPNIIVKSFRLQVIPEIRRVCQGVTTAALFAPKIMTMLRKEKYLLKIAQEFRADQISLHYTLVSKKFMKKAEKREIPVTVWTVDNPRFIKRAIDLGIKAVITNNPATLLEKKHEIMQAAT
ncbi:MAG: glycerophosphodiester phosphodiesterase family protein [Pyrinomonadaceae bacterium]